MNFEGVGPWLAVAINAVGLVWVLAQVQTTVRMQATLLRDHEGRIRVLEKKLNRIPSGVDDGPGDDGEENGRFV